MSRTTARRDYYAVLEITPIRRPRYHHNGYKRMAWISIRIETKAATQLPSSSW